MSDGLISRLRRIVVPGEEDEEDREYQIRLVVGLGNPGKEYAETRHNVGFRTINRLARRHGIELDAKRQVSYGTGEIAGREVVLAKPRTYVNKSGEAVWSLIKKYELDDARELFVVYDDLDLPVGKTRIRRKGGDGGYGGLKSIIKRTGNGEFGRLRIGIGRPVVNGEPTWDPDHISDYVLSDPPPDERELLDAAIERSVEAIECALADGIERAMARYNQ